MSISKKWTISVFLSIVILVAVVVSVNVIVDTYGIFRTDFSRQIMPPNINYVKIKYLLENKNRFDSYVFGSSRVSYINEEKITNGRYYNMFYAEGVPEEHLANIRFLLKNGVSIKNLMIGLDEFSYVIDPKQHLSSLLVQPYPGVSGKKLQNFYGEYFFRLDKFIPELEDYLKHNYTKRNDSEEKRVIFDMYGTGRILLPAVDEEIERNVQAHIHDKKFSEPFHRGGDNSTNALAAMREIVALAKKDGINITVFINPIHKTTYLDANLGRFAFFKKKLAAITDYYDFSGLNSITTNNYYYYESSHYRLLVGDMMLKTMLGVPKVAVPPDFGFHVTRKNIDSHLRSQCREIRKIKNGLNPVNSVFTVSCDKIPD
jgi:hypothetical protein